MKTVEPPRAREYIVLADHDAAGIEAARHLAERLASRVTVRIATPEREGEDWNDVLRRDRGGDSETLGRAIIDAPSFEAPSTIRRVKTMGEFIATPCPPIKYLLKPILETSSIAMLHAKRGSGKTYLALAIAYGIATGQGLLGWEATRPMRVLYIDGEMPTAKLQKRLQLLGRPSDNLSVLSRDDLMREFRLSLPDLGTPEGRKFLDDIIEAGGFEVVLLDSVSTLVRSGVENEAEAWAPIQEWMLGHRFRERTFIIIHHEGRSGHARGTSKREDVLDTIMRLEGDDDQAKPHESVFKLSFKKARDFYGEDTAPLLLRFSTASGVAVWSHQTVKDNMQERVAGLLAQGMKQAEIAKELDVSKPRISQIVKKLDAKEKVKYES
jgi:putative DNA primase/helicase